jgi:transglutaminase/protease-like cytokinesis protein 3
MLMGNFPAYKSPFSKINRGNVNKALSALPKRTSSTVEKFSTQLKTVKTKMKLNNAETAFLIFRWLTENIKYDCYNLVHDIKKIDHLATGTFKTGVGVCSGYSFIFEMWGKDLGLDAIYVYGYSKSLMDIGTFSTQYTHAWNIIKIDGVQYLVDSTWGAGGCDGDKFVKNYNEFYFCTNPEYYIRTHFPLENNNYQLLNTIVSSKEFADMVVLAEGFYGKGFKTISQNKAIFQMTGNYKMSLTFENGKNYFVGAAWLYKNGNQYVEESNFQTTSTNAKAEIQILPKKKTQYELRVAGGPVNAENFYPFFAFYRFTNN